MAREQQGRVLHVCVSARKGTCKTSVAGAEAVVGHGLQSDAHAGAWHRQVSLLSHMHIESMRAKGLKLKPGAFGENLVVDGLDTGRLGVGSRLRVGPVLLELTQVGKVCHTRCAIYHTTGDCIMPRTGLFARVCEGGQLAPGMPVEVVREVPRSSIQAAVVTVSDRCSTGATVDTAGPAVTNLLQDELKAHVAWTVVVPDEEEQIAAALRDLADRRTDLIITVGGTGISARDVTPEAIRKVLDRELPGISEHMRAVSAKITPNALLSRFVAGIRRETLILTLPGSRKAAVENLQAVLPALLHATQLLRGEVAHQEADAGRVVTLTATSNGRHQIRPSGGSM